MKDENIYPIFDRMLSRKDKDTGVKVEAMIADDQKFAAVQISEYIPYSYEAVTPVMCYYGEEARLLASYLKVS